MFLYRFDTQPELVEGWTTDKRARRDGLARIQPRGGTAMYDAVADAVPLAQTGRHRKKALVIISDGNDTSSRTDVRELKRMIRETEVLVYAIGIDSAGEPRRRGGAAAGTRRSSRRTAASADPASVSVPRRRRPPIAAAAALPAARRHRAAARSRGRVDERVNVAALRDITDDSGGRTEIVR